MSQRLKNTLTSLIIGAVLMSGVAFAFTGTRELRANYMDIEIIIDGETLIPKDVNETVVEPFTVDGTTYVPIRAISEAYGKDVVWDGANKTVTVTTPEEPVNTSLVRIERRENLPPPTGLATTSFYAVSYLESSCVDFFKEIYVFGPTAPVEKQNTITTWKEHSRDIGSKEMEKLKIFLENLRNSPGDCYAKKEGNTSSSGSGIIIPHGFHYIVDYLGEGYVVNTPEGVKFFDEFFGD